MDSTEVKVVVFLVPEDSLVMVQIVFPACVVADLPAVVDVFSLDPEVDDVSARSVVEDSCDDTID